VDVSPWADKEQPWASALSAAFGPAEGALNEKEKKQFESATIAIQSKCSQFSAARTLLDPSSPLPGDDTPSWLTAALRTSGPVSSLGMGARFVQAVHFDTLTPGSGSSAAANASGGSAPVSALSDPWANSDSEEEQQPATLSWKQQLEKEVPLTSLPTTQEKQEKGVTEFQEAAEGTPEADPNWGRPLPPIPTSF
jgi:hypothetical protein